MSKREDIPDRLIYTCNCGWVDKGHANPTKSSRPFVGAVSLWEQVSGETGQASKTPKENGFLVTYKQDAGRRVFGQLITSGITKEYMVKRGLTLEQKKSVALAIFMEVSYEFEDYQGWFPSDSSFSVEDLVSDLLGFYKAVDPATDYLALCNPVSAEASREVWDKWGPVGSHKNKTWMPKFFQCSDCATPAQFPKELQTITPAKKGTWHRDWTVMDRGGPMADWAQGSGY